MLAETEDMASSETSTGQDRKKVVLLTEIMSPYRTPVFNEIAKNPSFDFEVIYLAETSGGRKWDIDRQAMNFSFHQPQHIRIPLPDRFPVFFNPGLYRLLKKLNPDLMICGGYHHPSYVMAGMFAVRHRKKFVLWCESHEKSVRIRSRLANFYRKVIFRKSSAFIVPGKCSARFIQKYTGDTKPIYVAPNAVDNDFFYQRAAVHREKKSELKRMRNFPRHLILYVGRLLSSKGLGTLLAAYQQLSRPDTGLLIVGEGPEEKHYKEYCAQHHISNVYFEGHKQQRDLPYYYGLSDLFVMPSLRDEWGLVTNEAMASGLPVIVSGEIGAAADLVEEGANGYAVAGGDTEALRLRIANLLDDEALRKRMGERSLEIIKNYHPQKCAEGFISAVLGTVPSASALPSFGGKEGPSF
ncbi:MAG: glycosyltransferase family 4 protein [Candidatus Omnitrophica bacterium]|nr:glycosyltransferase family 4 protein [Candidatus Omnitrophota bacterium]